MPEKISFEWSAMSDYPAKNHPSFLLRSTAAWWLRRSTTVIKSAFGRARSSRATGSTQQSPSNGDGLPVKLTGLPEYQYSKLNLPGKNDALAATNRNGCSTTPSNMTGLMCDHRGRRGPPGAGDSSRLATAVQARPIISIAAGDPSCVESGRGVEGKAAFSRSAVGAVPVRRVARMVKGFQPLISHDPATPKLARRRGGVGNYSGAASNLARTLEPRACVPDRLVQCLTHAFSVATTEPAKGHA